MGTTLKPFAARLAPCTVFNDVDGGCGGNVKCLQQYSDMPFLYDKFIIEFLNKLECKRRDKISEKKVEEFPYEKESDPKKKLSQAFKYHCESTANFKQFIKKIELHVATLLTSLLTEEAAGTSFSKFRKRKSRGEVDTFLACFIGGLQIQIERLFIKRDLKVGGIYALKDWDTVDSLEDPEIYDLDEISLEQLESAPFLKGWLQQLQGLHPLAAWFHQFSLQVFKIRMELAISPQKEVTEFFNKLENWDLFETNPDSLLTCTLEHHKEIEAFLASSNNTYVKLLVIGFYKSRLLLFCQDNISNFADLFKEKDKKVFAHECAKELQAKYNCSNVDDLLEMLTHLKDVSLEESYFFKYLRFEEKVKEPVALIG